MRRLWQQQTGKRICVLSGSRTGSSLMQFILWRYISRKWDYHHKPLGDLMLRSWMYDTGLHVAMLRMTHLTPQEAWVMPISREFEYNRRVELLRKYHSHRYFMKLPAAMWVHCNQENLQYLHGTYHFVVVDRENRRERALSYAIAMISNFYTLRNMNQVGKFKGGEFTEELGDMIRYDFDCLKLAKKVVEHPDISSVLVSYEELDALEDKFEILGHLGYDDWEDYIEPKDRNELPFKIGSAIDKDSYITNIEEFDDWFQKNLGD